MVSQHFFMPPYCQKLIGKTAIAAMPNFPPKSFDFLVYFDTRCSIFLLYTDFMTAGSLEGFLLALDQELLLLLTKRTS